MGRPSTQSKGIYRFEYGPFPSLFFVMSTRLLLGDAETLLTNLLGAHLSKIIPGVKIESIRTLRELERQASEPFHLAILDITLADGDIFEWLRVHTQNGGHRRIVVLTSRLQEAVVHRLHQLGIRNLVDKADALPEVERALQLVLARGTVASKRVNDVQESMRNDPNCFAKVLTDREQEVLAQYGAGGTAKTVAQTLGISEVTVQTHRKNLMGKLNLRGHVELISFALEKGFFPIAQKPSPALRRRPTTKTSTKPKHR